VKLTRHSALVGPYSKTLRTMRLAIFALFLFGVGLIVWNWHASQWWEVLVGLAAGYAASMVTWCVVPPRFPPPWPWSKLIAAYRARVDPSTLETTGGES
jgi:hypothetical protein